MVSKVTRSYLASHRRPGGVEVILDETHGTGNVFFVDAGTGTDGAGYGANTNTPFATIDYAVGQCTANSGDRIMVMEGHVETVAGAAGIDVDVAGVRVIGLGQGDDRPTITLTATASTVEIGAASCSLENLIFVTGIDAVVIIVDVNADDALVLDCEFREASTMQWVTAIDINGGGANAADRATVIGCVLKSEAAGATNGIELGEVADGVVIEGCDIWGDFINGGIHNPTGKILTNLRIENNVVANLQTGDHAIELVSACTGQIIGNRLFGDTAGAVLDPGSCFCQRNTQVNAIDSDSVPVPAVIASPTSILGNVVDRTTATLPQTAAAAIFTVAGGRVMITSIIGEVTTVIQTQANNTKLTANPTTGTSQDICAALDITADEAGALWGITGTYTDALQGGVAGAAPAPSTPVVVNVGAIDLDCAASNTGSVKWTLTYVPIDAGATVVAA